MGTYAANSELRDALKLPRRVIVPREASCDPARERIVVEAGIVTDADYVRSKAPSTAKPRSMTEL